MIPAPRSSGSTLKPLLYAAMLQDGEILPGTLIKDTPYNYNNFAPHNHSRSYDGAVPASEVISRSLNVPSVRMLEQYGVPRFLSLLQDLGFSTITRSADHYGLSLILGGAEITLEDLVGVYTELAACLAGQESALCPWPREREGPKRKLGRDSPEGAYRPGPSPAVSCCR